METRRSYELMEEEKCKEKKQDDGKDKERERGGKGDDEKQMRVDWEGVVIGVAGDGGGMVKEEAEVGVC